MSRGKERKGGRQERRVWCRCWICGRLRLKRSCPTGVALQFLPDSNFECRTLAFVVIIAWGRWRMTMAITLTENAAKQIQKQLAKRGKGLALRVGVKKVGCSGFAYTYAYADELRESDRMFES